MKLHDTTHETPPEATKSELEILQALWEKGPSTVRAVNELLNEQRRDVNYSSTLKLMQIMLDKGLLHRDIVERSHVYRPAYSQEATQTQVIRNVVNLAFGGSASSLVLRALGAGNASPEALEEIKEMIRKIETERGD